MSLFNLDNHSNETIQSIIDEALAFKNGKKVNYNNEKVITTLFFEASTRTHYSFVMAAKRLGCQSIEFNPESSSLKKNESQVDTINFFARMHPDLMIIRSSEEEYYKQLNNINIPIINGGDGTKDHPSQSLLDLVTIYEQFKSISDLNILIVGDIKHSRVAHSNIKVLQRLNNNIFVSGPKALQDEDYNYVELDEYLPKIDVLMLLRVQNERHEDQLNQDSYLEKHGLTKQRYDMLKEDAIIMHPAPFNRGVEIADEVIDLPKCKIFDQMENGLYLRMAVINNELK